MSRAIPLTKGRFACVDADLYDMVSEKPWYHGAQNQALRRQLKSETGYKDITVSMHQMVLAHADIITGGRQITHLNGCNCDNRVENLFVGRRSLGSGVTKAQSRLWRADIWVKGQGIFLGYHREKEDAIAAREAAEVKYLGRKMSGTPCPLIGTDCECRGCEFNGRGPEALTPLPQYIFQIRNIITEKRFVAATNEHPDRYWLKLRSRLKKALPSPHPWAIQAAWNKYAESKCWEVMVLETISPPVCAAELAALKGKYVDANYDLGISLNYRN